MQDGVFFGDYASIDETDTSFGPKPDPSLKHSRPPETEVVLGVSGYSPAQNKPESSYHAFTVEQTRVSNFARNRVDRVYMENMNLGDRVGTLLTATGGKKELLMKTTKYTLTAIQASFEKVPTLFGLDP